jgi:hypothetical protein
LPAQDIVALAANGQDLDRLALRNELGGMVTRQARDGGIEATGQAAFTGGDHQQMHLVSTRAAEQHGGVFLPIIDGAQRRQNLAHAFGIGTGSLRCFLGTAELGRRHHLHGLGDLLGRFDRVDPVLEVL